MSGPNKKDFPDFRSNPTGVFRKKDHEQLYFVNGPLEGNSMGKTHEMKSQVVNFRGYCYEVLVLDRVR